MRSGRRLRAIGNYHVLVHVAAPRFEPIVGDVDGNADRMLDLAKIARADGADVLVTPELSICGYPPRDLMLRSGFVAQCERALDRIAAQAPEGLLMLVGSPVRVDHGQCGNAMVGLLGGQRVGVAHKRLLPMYDVFDETRWFAAGAEACVMQHAGHRIGVVVCEDLWQSGDAEVQEHWMIDPVAEVVAAGCDVLVAASASPVVVGKYQRQLQRVSEVAQQWGLPVIAVNQAGAHDDLVFDGSVMVGGAAGEALEYRAPFQREDRPTMVAVSALENRAPQDLSPDAYRCQALIEGVRCYIDRVAAPGVLVGLSGGIDSAVTAAVAAAAIGPERVHGVSMPSQYSSERSTSEAEALVQALGMPPLVQLSIADLHTGVRDIIDGVVHVEDGDIADQNVQARARGLLLMAMSNATGRLVLATGNKSELAVGYATLYGDMCGAIAVLGDVLKTQVYSMAAWMNQHYAEIGLGAPPIPQTTIERPPTAELAPDQCDQDSLPPYEQLDAIIEAVVEYDCGLEDAVAKTGLSVDLVSRWMAVIDRQEFKRAQAALILKTSRRAFGRGRRWPIVGR